MHISSSYAKILGGKLFRTWEITRSGSKAKDGEKDKKKRERESALRTQAAWAKRNVTSQINKCGASYLPWCLWYDETGVIGQ